MSLLTNLKIGFLKIVSVVSFESSFIQARHELHESVEPVFTLKFFCLQFLYDDSIFFDLIQILAVSKFIRDMRSFAKIFVRPDSIKSPTGHFSEIRSDTGPDLTSFAVFLS